MISDIIPAGLVCVELATVVYDKKRKKVLSVSSKMKRL